jgi:hypothetical protein
MLVAHKKLDEDFDELKTTSLHNQEKASALNKKATTIERI